MFFVFPVIGWCHDLKVRIGEMRQKRRELRLERRRLGGSDIGSLVNQIVSALDRAVMHMDVDQNLFAQTSQDRKEAVRAYMNKTRPSFTGD